MKITWNGFLGLAIDEYPNEVCGFLFSRKPYSPDEEWFVFPVKNISETPENSWIPDRNDTYRVKRKAIEMGLTKIGNIHTHPYPKGYPFCEHLLQDKLVPSGKDTTTVPGISDLEMARRWNDIIRGILVVGADAIYGLRWHDKFGKEIDIVVESKEQKM